MKHRPLLARSLVVKIYVFAVAALVALGVLAFFGGRVLVEQGRLDALREYRMGQAGYLAREIEASFVGERPAPERLRRLGKELRARVVFLPWVRALEAHPELARESIVAVPTGRFGPARYLVRVERDGRPFGALRVDYRPPFVARHHRPWVGPLATMIVVGLITIPPLILWVVVPLRRMEAVAVRLGEGKLDEPVVIKRRDEFGRLEQAFESLRVRILQMLHQRDRLLTDISHELRSPLSRMAIALSLARSAEGSDRISYLDQMEKDLRATDELIGELLAFARGRSPQGRQEVPLDLRELAARALADRSLVASQRDQDVVCRLEPAPVVGDERLLSRALGNLLDNAIKFTPRGGRIDIGTATDGAEAVFRVGDSGPGIPAEELAHVFEPFYRPDTARTREGGGTGLGLAIVRAVAESHGGRVTLQSDAGAGTMAELRLPGRAPPEAIH